MVICSFCGKEVAQGCGKLYIKTDGRVLNFCSRKCEKNMLLLKRKPRNIRWTEDSIKERKLAKAKKEGTAVAKKSKPVAKSSAKTVPKTETKPVTETKSVSKTETKTTAAKE
ncbi:hypothetical protein HN587_07935 [Candidatus Woesearchaeota archaeon]|jgi:large subunit ribosomal protein L24e|nr:hypothetical protein [Candidatus Woesearchaeota archaeon]